VPDFSSLKILEQEKSKLFHKHNISFDSVASSEHQAVQQKIANWMCPDSWLINQHQNSIVASAGCTFRTLCFARRGFASILQHLHQPDEAY
jgi:hypothetical protein